MKNRASIVSYCMLAACLALLVGASAPAGAQRVDVYVHCDPYGQPQDLDVWVDTWDPQLVHVDRKICDQY